MSRDGQSFESSVVVTPVAAQAAWLSVHFILDVANISRGGGDLLDPLIATAVVDANQAALHGDPALQRLYGDETHALPDEHRRPISVMALAESLRLPFETVRRRVRRLADAGLCQVGEGGVVVPQAVVTSAPYLAVQTARVARLARFEADLLAAGVLAAPTGLGDGVATRSADRALAGYMLRACDQLIALTGGAMAGFMLLGLAAANSEVSGAAAPRLADLASQPASAADLARRLHMPHETVRRNLFALAELGFARRQRLSWLVAVPEAQATRLGHIAADIQINLRRLFARLAELADPAAASTAADLRA